MSCRNCPGCSPNYQPNQMAHMEFGGCLYVEDKQDDADSMWETDSESDDFSEMANAINQDQTAALEEGARRLLDMDFGDDESIDEEQEHNQEKPEFIEKPPLFDAPIPLGECPICYEDLKMIDFTVTKCGHTFHSSCVFKAMEQNVDCPMCRCQLIEIHEDQEDEDQEDEEDEDQEDEEDEDQEYDEPKVTMEQLATKLQNMGYTAVDFLTFVMGASLKRQDEDRQTDEFLSELSNKIDDIVDGKITLAHRDQRSYAQVAKSQQTPTQIQEA